MQEMTNAEVMERELAKGYVDGSEIVCPITGWQMRSLGDGRHSFEKNEIRSKYLPKTYHIKTK